MMATPSQTGHRSLVVWFPHWPVTAWELANRRVAEHPVAVVAANRVTACSAAAEAEGIQVGQRRREAQSRCHRLDVVAADETRDLREFNAVLDVIESLSPGVQLIGPGACVLPARGLATYLGSEAEAAEVLLEAIGNHGVDTGRIGIADGIFAARQAARQAGPVLVVPPGRAVDFLASLPVVRLGDPELATLLPRLGIHTLGDFAGLEPASVRARFGENGTRLHRLASGVDPRQVQPRTPPPDLTGHLEFEPPLTLVDQIAFAVSAMAGEFVASLAAAGLAATEVLVEVSAEEGEVSSRIWLHPTMFDAAALVDRIRWQVQAAAGAEIRSGVVKVTVEPVAVDDRGHHDPGLFGLGPDERVHHALSRVQAMLGHTGVLTPRICGGRWLTDRQVLVPWGDRLPEKGTSAPWPGRLPDPLPATVFAQPLPLAVLDATGEPVVVDARGALSAAPAVLIRGGDRTLVQAWAGPWPVTERGWDPLRHREANRFQIIDDVGGAWLLLRTVRGWWAEARYD